MSAESVIIAKRYFAFIILLFAHFAEGFRYQINFAYDDKNLCFSFMSCHSEVIVSDHVISMQRKLGMSQ